MRLKLLLLSIIFSLPNLVQSQEYYAIEVIGYVKEGKRKLKGATIALSSNAREPDTVIVTPDGKFILSLDFEKDYIIEMSKLGFISKKFAFSTRNVPEKDKKKPYGFEFEISLFKEMDDFQISVFKKPVAKVVFNQKTAKITSGH